MTLEISDLNKLYRKLDAMQRPAVVLINPVQAAVFNNIYRNWRRIKREMRKAKQRYGDKWRETLDTLDKPVA